MKKIEIIWRELLYQAIEKKNHRFTQKDLAAQFNFSVSTVFQALKVPRKMGAVRVMGRFFILEDPEKLLYHWASSRNLKKELLLEGYVDLPISEIESQMPASVVFGGFGAAKFYLSEPPADYAKVVVFLKDPKLIYTRFQFKKVKKGPTNLILLKPDDFLTNYGSKTTLAQTFVDLWNLPDWYAKEFTQALKKKIDELLS